MCTNTLCRLSTHDYACENEWNGIEEQTWYIVTQTLRYIYFLFCIDLNIAQWMCVAIESINIDWTRNAFRYRMAYSTNMNGKKMKRWTSECVKWRMTTIRLVSIVSKPIVQAKPQKLKRKFIIEMCE